MLQRLHDLILIILPVAVGHQIELFINGPVNLINMVQLQLQIILQKLHVVHIVYLKNATPTIQILAAGVIELQRSLITHQFRFIINIVLKKLVTLILVLILTTIHFLIIPILTY